MFKVKKGMVLIMVGVALVMDALVGCEWREHRTKRSDPMSERTVRLADVMWKKTFRWDFDPWSSISIAKKGAFPGTQRYDVFLCFFCDYLLWPGDDWLPEEREHRLLLQWERLPKPTWTASYGQAGWTLSAECIYVSQPPSLTLNSPWVLGRSWSGWGRWGCLLPGISAKAGRCAWLLPQVQGTLGLLPRSTSYHTEKMPDYFGCGVWTKRILGFSKSDSSDVNFKLLRHFISCTML